MADYYVSRAVSPGCIGIAASDSLDRVKRAAYATCDGTSDQQEIQAGIAALSTAGGRVVLSEGTFNVSGTILIQKDNVNLVGVGCGARGGGTPSIGGTTIKSATGLTGSVIEVSDPAGVRTMACNLLRDFTIDGVNVGTTVDGVLFKGNRGRLEDVYVTRMTGHGVRLGGTSTWSTFNTRLSGVWAEFCALNGFYVDQYASDSNFFGCIGNNNTQDGLKAIAAAPLINGCHFYDNTGKGIEFVGNGFISKITGVRIEGNNGGLYLSGAGSGQVTVTGCGFRNNSQATTNTTDDISVGTSSSAVVITGNSFIGDGANKVRYGVDVVSGAVGTIIVGNSMPAAVFGTAAVHDLGTGTVNANNG